MGISDYWKSRDEKKKKAVKHTEYVAEAFANEIASSTERSVIYGVEARTPERDESKKRDWNEPKISFLNTDTVSAIFKCEEGKKIAALNFASYKNPGGKFLEGSSAQEESLCHESFLYNVLRNFPGYYAWNDEHKKRALYENRAIYSPGIVFERNGVLRKADIITCAAPNWGAASKYNMASQSQNTMALADRIAFVRDIVEENKPDVLILGAYGCGVFGQDPEEVAFMFDHAFRHSTIPAIVYAVLGGEKDKNVLAFKQKFGKKRSR